jgi:hypothetical protein
MILAQEDILGPQRRWSALAGACLLWVYVVTGLLGKSQLPGYGYDTWRGYMMMSTIVIGGLLMYCIAGRSAARWNISGANGSHVTWLGLFIMWGIVVSAMQKYPLDNLLYFATLASMFIVSMMLPNAVPAMRDPARFLNMVVLVTTPWVCLSLLEYFVGSSGALEAEGRLRGCFLNCIILGGISGLNCLLLVWLLLVSPRYRCLRLILLGIAWTTLALTKCRGQNVTIALGAAVMILLSRRPGNRVFLVLCATLIGAALYIGLFRLGVISDEKIDDAREFFRVSAGEIESTAEDRWISYWSKGIADITSLRVIGQGPLARFGGGGHGFENSNYDVSLNRHSQPLLVAQGYGIPGLLCWIAFILSAAYAAAARRDSLGILAAGIFSSWMVMGLFSESLMSFGTPVDRLKWLVLGLVLTAPRLTLSRPSVAGMPTW